MNNIKEYVALVLIIIGWPSIFCFSYFMSSVKREVNILHILWALPATIITSPLQVVFYLGYFLIGKPNFI